MDEVVATLEGAADDAERLVAANNFVREIMKRNEPAPLWFIRIADRWLTESPSPQVADLVAATGMSIRSVERMTKPYYGLSPRMLARTYLPVRAAAPIPPGGTLDTEEFGARGIAVPRQSVSVSVYVGGP